MKPNYSNKNLMNLRTGVAHMNSSPTSREEVLSQMAKVREAIFAESRGSLMSQERLLRLALNEAEALAWETRFPQLVFPDLALEKIRAVIGWNNRQRSIRPMGKIISLVE